MNYNVLENLIKSPGSYFIIEATEELRMKKYLKLPELAALVGLSAKTLYRRRKYKSELKGRKTIEKVLTKQQIREM